MISSRDYTISDPHNASWPHHTYAAKEAILLYSADFGADFGDCPRKIQAVTMPVGMASLQQTLDSIEHAHFVNFAYISKSFETISGSVRPGVKPYAFITAASFAAWALRSSGGIVSGSYRSASDESG